ncbi:hypothetical protein SDC9_180681 [bioreactor metagenome]|uniref:Uncharacterized protein n=1 Tax=bioreactor metagenome TaxID=1076179 RepID=A0A645H2G0_9ZZZZ
MFVFSLNLIDKLLRRVAGIESRINKDLPICEGYLFREVHLIDILIVGKLVPEQVRLNTI